MAKFASLGAAGLLSIGAALIPVRAAEEFPNFSPDSSTSWAPDRPAGDDFLPPPSGPGPVTAEKEHPYVPSGSALQATYRIADLSNPILKPWVVEQMRRANDRVRAGKVPFTTRERCWPTGVPGFEVFTRVEGIYFAQTQKEITVIHELDQQTRHIYMNVPHSKNPKPSWYGESVGHYDGDELLVDTIGMNDRSFVDNYRTPHTDQIHVVERFKIIEGGKTLQSTVTVEDPGAFNMAWSAVQRWRRVHNRPMIEQYCAENNDFFFGYEVVPMPEAKGADF